MTDYRIELEPEKKPVLTEEQEAYIVISNTIAALPEDIRAPIMDCANKILFLVKFHKDAGLMALALVGTKLQAELPK